MKKKKGSAGTAATIGGAGILALAKSKFLFIAVRLLKFKSLWTMLLSIWAYALLYGWKFGVAFVYLMFIHEMGHFYAAKYKKIQVSPAVFIPFFGAFVQLKEFPKSLKDDVFIAIMGPFAGLLSIVPFFIMFQVTGDAFWIRMFKVGAILNLFNLLPISPFDGGRIGRALSGKLLALGFVILLAFVFLHPNPILILIVLISLASVFTTAKDHYHWKEQAVYKEVYETALQKWDELRAAYDRVEEVDRVAWLNLVIHEENMRRETYYQEAAALDSKKSKWRWTPETEQYHRSGAQADAQSYILQHLNDWYDAEPETPHGLQTTLQEISTEVAKKESYEKLTTKQRIWILVQYISLVLLLTACIGYVIWLGL